MADANEMTDGDADAAVEMRPCAYCGALIHPASHRCTHCAGHVGLAWGTVHKETFLFLFLALATVVGCLAPWTGRTPLVEVTELVTPAAVAPGAAPGAPRPAPTIEKKTTVTQAVARMGGPRNGLDTTRGVFILAIALYGVLVGVFNAVYRRSTMWPAVANGFLCLWVGLQGVVNAMGSDAWGYWGTWAEGKNYLEKGLGATRAIAPGHALLAFVGLVTVFRLLAGILAAASKGKPETAAKEAGAAARRRRSKEASGSGDAPAGDAPAGDAPGV